MGYKLRGEKSIHNEHDITVFRIADEIEELIKNVELNALFLFFSNWLTNHLKTIGSN